MRLLVDPQQNRLAWALKKGAQVIARGNAIDFEEIASLQKAWSAQEVYIDEGYRMEAVRGAAKRFKWVTVRGISGTTNGEFTRLAIGNGVYHIPGLALQSEIEEACHA